MKKLILFLFLTINLLADNNTNSINMNPFTLDKFLSDMQDTYHLKIGQIKDHKIILTGQTIFQENNRKEVTYSCFKIDF
jgi:hypothetical protein